MRIAISVAILLVALCAQAAAPNPNRAKAKALYESAITHYNLSEYGDALTDFKEAYRLVNDPALLFNIAQCHRQLKAFDEAARVYRAYRRESPDALNRAEVDRIITQMDEAIAEQHTQSPPTGTLPPPVVAPVSPVVVTPVVVQPTTLVVSPDKPRPVYKKGWFWGVVAGAAVVVAVGVTVGVVLGTEKSPAPEISDVRF